jgi:putative ABC transport system permease protein
MEDLLSDLRYGLRLLRQRPGFAAVAILTLAIGTGANTAIFSVVNSVLIRPLPYEDPGELTMVWQDLARIDGPEREWATPDNFFDWRDQNEVFDGMFALGGWGPTLLGMDRPEQLNGAVTSFDALTLLGLEPILGRTFRPEEDTAASELVVVLGHSLWQRRFAGDPSVLGKTITLDSQPATIVGVLPPDFDFPIVQDPEILAPLRIDRTNTCGRGCYTLRVIARLKDGVVFERAQADMTAIAARLEQDYPDENRGVGIRLVPLHEQVVGPMRTALLVLLGAVGLVLLIACANVANLLLARATDRERELATRVALGASRARLLRQLLTESLLLAALGAALGLVLGLWGVDLLVSLVPDSVPRFREVSVDAPTLAATSAVAALAGLAFGLLPGLRASSPSLQRSLKEGGRGTDGGGNRRFRDTLVVVEVALALTLLVGAGLLMRSFASLVRVDPGFDADNVLVSQLNLVGVAYDETTDRVSFVDRLLTRVRALPGVEGAGVVYALPLGGADADANFTIEGRPPPPPQQAPVAWYRPVSHDYFETMKMRLARGRWFEATDGAEATPVVLVNEAAAERYWPNEDPLRSRVRIGGVLRQVVGVVADTRHFGLDQAPRPAMYFPSPQLPLRFTNLVVRTSGEPTALASSVRAAVAEIDPTLAIANVASMREVISDTVAAPRLITILLGVFALSALALAAIGLYGVMSYTVGQRRHEIGIRTALGAEAGDVVRWVVGRGMLLLVIGAAVGLTLSLALFRFLESLLFGISATDPTTFLAGAVVLAAVALVACYLPARRAASVDPMVALRHE